VSRAWWVRLFAAFALLAWWLPYDMGVRSEPFVALGSTTVFALLLRGTAPRAGRLLPLGVAALVTGLTVSLNPTGLIALVPVVVLAPRLARTLWRPEERGRPGERWLAGLGRLALLGCAASTALVVTFADQTWAGAAKATELHRYFGPAMPWYRELARYDYLLGNDHGGNATKRLPVLLTIALLIPVAMLINRGLRALPGMREAHLPALCAVLGFAALWLTPSKWSHHFGALAGLGSAFLVTAVVLIAAAAKHRSGDRAVLMSGIVGGGLGVVAAAISFAGKNNWYSYSEFGQPWTEGPVTPFNSVLLWVGGVVAIGAVLVAVAGRSRGSATAAAPAALGVLAPVIAVTVLLTSFTVAPLRQIGSHSLAEQNIRHLTGDSCGIVDKVVAMPDVPGGALRPTQGVVQPGGFAPGAGFAPAPPHEMPGIAGTTLLWGSNHPGLGRELNTGALTTQWFALPPFGPDRDLAVTVAGRTGDGNRLALEFAHSGAPLGERVLDDSYKASDKRPIYPTDRVPQVKPQDVPSWRALSVTADQVPPGADLVRVRAVDATTDKGGWMAVTQPRLREVVPLRRMLDERSPVLMSSDLSWSMPCVRNIPVLAHGLAQTPKTLVQPGDAFEGLGGVPFNEDVGGTFAGLRKLSTMPEIPTRLVGPELIPKHANWGHLVLVDHHPLLADAYSVHTTQVPRWGW
jgi:arabinosyltransferase C